MRRRNIGVGIGLAIAVVAALGWWNRGDDETAAGAPAFGGARPPATVTVAEVVHGPFVPETAFVGTLEARSSAQVAARSAGALVAVRADVGDRVRGGELLAQIDPAEEAQRLEQARAALRIAEATLDQRRAALGIAATTARRTAALLEQNLVPRQQYDAVVAELDGARAEVALAEAQVEQARAGRSGAEVALEQTRVVAPFDGVVGRRFLDLGDFAAQNEVVFQIADLSLIKVTVALPERQAARVEAGLPAAVSVASLPGETWHGRVARISDVLDPRSNTAETQIEVDNPDRRLKPGMFAEVTIALEVREEAMLVPGSAVVEEEGRYWVYVVEDRSAPSVDGPAAPAAGPAGSPDAIAHRREVTVLGHASGDDRVAVSGDLAPGQRVITLGHESLSDGAPVQVGDSRGGAERQIGRRGRPPAPGAEAPA